MKTPQAKRKLMNALAENSGDKIEELIDKVKVEYDYSCILYGCDFNIIKVSTYT